MKASLNMKNALHKDYGPIFDEVMDMPATLDENDWKSITFWIFLNRLLYGIHWKERYAPTR